MPLDLFFFHHSGRCFELSLATRYTSHRHRASAYTAPPAIVAWSDIRRSTISTRDPLPPISLTRRIRAALNSPSTTRSPSLVLFHATTCMRAHARLRKRRVSMLVYVREYVRAYVRAYVRMSVSHTLSLSSSVSLFLSLFLSLDPCTAASPAPGSRVGAAGRHSQDVSLSLAMFRPSNPP